MIAMFVNGYLTQSLPILYDCVFNIRSCDQKIKKGSKKIHGRCCSYLNILSTTLHIIIYLSLSSGNWG